MQMVLKYAQMSYAVTGDVKERHVLVKEVLEVIQQEVEYLGGALDSQGADGASRDAEVGALYGLRRKEAAEQDETGSGFLEITLSMATCKTKEICVDIMSNLCKLNIKDFGTHHETYQVSKIII